MDDTTSNTKTSSSRLIQAKRFIKFICLFAVFYGLLMAPWPGLGKAYSKLYLAGASALFKSFGSKGVVHFNRSDDAEYDINVGLYNRDQVDKNGHVTIFQASHTSRRDGYMYMTFMTALILASLIPWKRKVWALLLGLILIHGFIALKLAIRLLHAFSIKPLSLFALSPFWKRMLAIAHQQFVVNVNFGFVVSIFIWILVSFRREDWLKILSSRDEISGLG